MTALNVSMVTDHGHRIVLSTEGTQVELPPVENLLFYAGLGALVAANVVELPVALVLTVGHILIQLTHRPGLEALGAAFEEV